MGVRIVAGSAGRHLADRLAGCLGLELAAATVERFPDGELRPRVGPLHGDDVFLVAPTRPPVNESLAELLLLLDACRRAGAARVTAVVPYLGYARQDRRTAEGEAVGARLVADVLAAAGAQRLLVVDPHTPAVEAMFGIPVEMITAVPVLGAALAGTVPAGAVVLAPDLGAVRLAERVAAGLSSPVAVVRKIRLSGTEVQAMELDGEVTDRPLVVVDDMVSTGATVASAVRAALARGARPDVTVAAVHALLLADARRTLESLPLRRMVTTDTVPVPVPPRWLEVRSVAPVLADALGRLQHRRPLDDLLVGGAAASPAPQVAAPGIPAASAAPSGRVPS